MRREERGVEDRKESVHSATYQDNTTSERGEG
jgi:hypothetical protein